MTEENTKDLTDSEKLNLILTELADLRQWRARVDAFIDDRSRDTRPALGLIHKDIADLNLKVNELIADVREIKDRLAHVEAKLDVMTNDVADARAAQRILAGRVSALEQRPN